MGHNKSELLHEVGQFVAQLSEMGVKDVVLSPGSRVAPLALAFARHPKINTISVSDERSAAFVAMGIAQQTNTPVVIACTSGTAALNYTPAITEAYYQRIPVIVITADRPTEWIDQWDGQTIRQNNIFGNHIKKSFQMPDDLSHADAKWYKQRIANEALNYAMAYPQGPIHINWPLREPFYPDTEEHFDFDANTIRIQKELSSEPYIEDEVWEKELIPLLQSHQKILIVAGHGQYNHEVGESLSSLPFPVASDVISNYGHLENATVHQDVFLTPNENQALQPDLLITFGKSVISKNLKLFLRNNRPVEHWHIQEAGEVPDPFMSLTKVIRSSEALFFDQLSAINFDEEDYNQFLFDWQEHNNRVKAQKADFFELLSFSELEVVNYLINSLPENSNLHLANSMSVRYANFIGVEREDVKVYANRGTSGIDGSTSTAVGHAIANPDELHFILTGDLAFFYDRNAFWNNYVPSNLKVVLLNNHGGVIFRMIDGPVRQPELEEYFETEQRTSAKYLAEEFRLKHWEVNSREEFYDTFETFLQPSDKACIYEVKSNKEISKNTFKAFKREGMK
ncbi:2-succinyl-5-enolpyruvyl-6-hydroxy-3-cyclohexene-1-carboxylic-acid synthase [Flammeovirga sp. EKP202]|uniref:2-succinyl-5-enolpyruvyl-6-hydroxy-3- cyclohexene-1-carboxylic-acid synthase n=1 Tax=Flammeovirga sp. EKP202 TaxID=2770592 RepID=UPI00165F602B|nr:2-succinyl-5-enolpyruvyl-6-hydroxy-3-cyclohexene-1-carboxylic-acid synthase [Flammeovirga sp. EKP202]MBD0402858.1 2-succinyl-5-enolpyruvyl-6-hydroxy-3-cyclohexene-1-carboxylic-acid synthase [Flammeovirga sp. EKP202]